VSKFLSLLLLGSTLLLADKTIKIATYNIDNLFDLQKNGHEYKEYIPYSASKWNKHNYNIKLNHIATVLKDIDADVVALQEIESLQALKDLQRKLKQKDLYYNYYGIANAKNTTVKVAFLSKFPYRYKKEVRVTSSLKYRNILEVKFSFNHQDLYLFINHWKAKSGPESQRMVSAKALRKRLREIGYDKNILAVGDFNSDYEEYIKFKRQRRLNNTGGKTGINHILNTLNSTKKEYLYNLWYSVPKEERFSYIYKRKKEALDNMLVTKPLLHRGGIMYVDGSIHSVKLDYLFTKKGWINRWQTSRRKPHTHKGKGYSDHLPVVAEFRVFQK